MIKKVEKEGIENEVDGCECKKVFTKIKNEGLVEMIIVLGINKI